MSEYDLPLQGPRRGDCACGCGLWGTLRRRPLDHVRLCKCKQCQGKRNRSKGDRKAREARKQLGIGGANTRHEELWGGDIRVEVKAGAQIQNVFNAFLKCEQQSENHRPIGDWRPFAMIAMPDGTKDGLVIMRLSHFTQYTGTKLGDAEQENKSG